jgi:MED7 protein
MAAGRSLTDIKAELLRLNQGLPFLFVELLTALIQQPSAHAAALSQVMVTLHNMAHLINMARPLQVMLCSVPALYSPVPLICLGGLPSHTLSYPCPWCMQHTCCLLCVPTGCSRLSSSTSRIHVLLTTPTPPFNPEP